MRNAFKRAAAAAFATCLFVPFALQQGYSQTIQPSPLQTTVESAPTDAVIQPILVINRAAILDAARLKAQRPRTLSGLVEAHATAQTTGRVEDCLARAVYFESRGEPLEGQLAVAEVIINRVDSARFRNDVCSVIRQPYQFSFVERGVIPQPNRSSTAWRRAVAISRIALRDLWETSAANALYFHAVHVSPDWSRRMRRQARVGRHIFYR